MTALQEYLTGRQPLPFTRQHRRMKTRRIMLDIAGEHMYPRPDTDIPTAAAAGRVAADWHTSGMVDAMINDPRLRIELVD